VLYNELRLVEVAEKKGSAWLTPNDNLFFLRLHSTYVYNSLWGRSKRGSRVTRGAAAGRAEVTQSIHHSRTLSPPMQHIRAFTTTWYVRGAAKLIRATHRLAHAFFCFVLTTIRKLLPVWCYMTLVFWGHIERCCQISSQSLMRYIRANRAYF